jgi:hypothetical protein
MAEGFPQNSYDHADSVLVKTPASVVQTMDLNNEMSEADRALAAKFGYKPVFKRQFGYLATFSFAVSVGGVYSSIATTFIYPLQAGGSASVVSCTYPHLHFHPALLTTSKVGLSRVLGACALRYVNSATQNGQVETLLPMDLELTSPQLSVSELVSAYPTCGGLYYTVSRLAPERYVLVLSWVTGWLNVLGQLAGVAASEWGAAALLLAAVSISSDFTYFPTVNHTIATMAGMVVLSGLANSLSTY